MTAIRSPLALIPDGRIGRRKNHTRARILPPGSIAMACVTQSVLRAPQNMIAVP
jgi:hypothetical protein